MKFLVIFFLIFVAILAIGLSDAKKCPPESSSSSSSSSQQVTTTKSPPESSEEKSKSGDDDDDSQEEDEVEKKENDEKFKKWSKKFEHFYRRHRNSKVSNKTYGFNHHERRHFARHRRHALRHNSRFRHGKEAYEVDEMGIFAGLTTEEIKTTMTGLIHSEDEKDDDAPGVVDEKLAADEALDSDESGDSGFPENFSWLEEYNDCVLPIVSQGKCANCFVFAATSAIEWHYCLSTGKRVKFSEQQMTDCTMVAPYNNKGCNGGKVATIFEYAAKRKYLCTDKTVPFRVAADKTKCAESTCKKKDKHKVSMMYRPYYRKVAVDDVRGMMKAIYERGPITTEFGAEKLFSAYKKGIYTGEEACSASKRDHVMLVLGWGVDKPTGKKYWIVRNSWSELWGDKGHVLIERGRNVCGIEQAARYPLFQY